MGMTQHPRRSRSLLKATGAAFALALLTVAAGCGDDTKTDSAAEIAFAGQWARTSPAMASMGAAYVTITSPNDDALVGAKVDASVAATIGVHETVMAEDMGSDTTLGAGSDTTVGTGGGEMTMRPVASVVLPAGVAVELTPGGYHIMLIDLVKPLAVGTTLSITLVFEKAGEIVIEVPVLDEAP